MSNVRKNILIISDTHGDRVGVERLLGSYAQKNDAVIFLGDGIRDFFEDGKCICPVPFYCVCGNCDTLGFSSAPLVIDGYGEVRHEEFINIGGTRILITHGHKYDVKSGLDRLARYAATVGADIALYGHTHIKNEYYIPEGESVCFEKLAKPLWLFNPGSLRGSYFNEPSFGTLTLSSDGVIFGHGTL